MKTYLILGLLIGLVSTINGDDSYYHNTKTYRVNINEDNYGTGTDRQVLESAREIIDNDNINVDVLNGKLTLNGRVATQQEKNQILVELQRLKGVRSIDSENLTVSPDRATSSSQTKSSLWW